MNARAETPLSVSARAPGATHERRSIRDRKELLVEQGGEVDHVTVYRWVQRFTPMLADVAPLAR